MPMAYTNRYSPGGASRLLPSRANRAEPRPNLASFMPCKLLYINGLTPKTKPPQKYRETVKSSLLCAARTASAPALRAADSRMNMGLPDPSHLEIWGTANLSRHIRPAVQRCRPAVGLRSIMSHIFMRRPGTQRSSFTGLRVVQAQRPVTE